MSVEDIFPQSPKDSLYKSNAKRSDHFLVSNESVLHHKGKKYCAVCNDHAVGFNFGAIACESCKAFFRRNALRVTMPSCFFNGKCSIQVKTRRFCSPCRLNKCFQVGMRKECIMDEKSKIERREKIMINRARKVANQVNYNTTSRRHSVDGIKQAKQQCTSVNSFSFLMKPPYSKQCIEFDKSQNIDGHPLTYALPNVSKFDQTSNVVWNSANAKISLSEKSHQFGRSSVDRQFDDDKNLQKMNTDHIVLSKPIESKNNSFHANTAFSNNRDTSELMCMNSFPQMSTVTNVLDGHVWTVESEKLSTTKDCISLCSSFVKTGMARLLSKDQWAALNDLRSAYDTSFLNSVNDKTPDNSTILTISSLVNTSGFLVRKFINFAKKLADFSVLSQESQICLLKGVVLNALFIRSASHYDVVKDVWITPSGEIPTQILKIATGLEKLYEEHAKYCRNFCDIVQKDSHLVALMQVLCLFTPDRPRLKDRQSVSNIYDRYILLLKHYLEARHGFTIGRCLLANVLTNLAELQALTDNYGHILLHVDPNKVDPLILEVFNLPHSTLNSRPVISLPNDSFNKNNRYQALVQVTSELGHNYSDRSSFQLGENPNTAEI